VWRLAVIFQKTCQKQGAYIGQKSWLYLPRSAAPYVHVSSRILASEMRIQFAVAQRYGLTHLGGAPNSFISPIKRDLYRKNGHSSPL
jgi:hypothetical protein